MGDLLYFINQNLTFFIIVPTIFIVGIYLTIKTKVIQITKLHIGLSHLVMKEEKEKGSISNFQAISAVLAGNLGTGNISGMAVALTFGGPGALFWMWVMVFLGAIFKHSGCYLGFLYRQQNKENEFVGGPMYYLSRGLNSKTLGILFAVFCISTSLTAGNFVQINSIVLPLKEFGINPLFLGILFALLVGVTILGGTLRFAKVAEIIVPLMAFIYFTTSLVILIIYAENILPSFKMIFLAAFKPIAISSGIFGFGFFHAISAGFERGIFATDAAVGIAPILQSGAREKKPILEGFVAMTAPFFVMIICTMTVLVLMITNAWKEPNLESTNMCVWAFSKGIHSKLGGHIIIISLLFFAFTTILAWAEAASKAVEFIFNLKWAKFFKYIFVFLVPLGSILEGKLLWILADLSMSFMLIFNVIAIIFLSDKVIKDTLAFKKK